MHPDEPSNDKLIKIYKNLTMELGTADIIKKIKAIKAQLKRNGVEIETINDPSK